MEIWTIEQIWETLNICYFEPFSDDADVDVQHPQNGIEAEDTAQYDDDQKHADGDDKPNHGDGNEDRDYDDAYDDWNIQSAEKRCWMI